MAPRIPIDEDEVYDEEVDVEDDGDDDDDGYDDDDDEEATPAKGTKKKRKSVENRKLQRWDRKTSRPSHLLSTPRLLIPCSER